MAERIFQVHVHGRVGFEDHLAPDDHIDVEESESLVTVNIRSSSRPFESLFTPVDQLNDNTSGSQTTIRAMVPNEGAASAPASVQGAGEVTNPEPSLTTDLLVPAADITVEELKDILRDKDLKVSGTKAELIARLNEAE